PSRLNGGQRASIRLHLAASASRPKHQFVHPRPHGRRTEAAYRPLLTGGRTQRLLFSGTVRHGGWLLQSGQIFRGGDAERAKGLFFTRLKVGNLGEIVLLEAVLHTEFVVEAAVALGGKAVENFVEWSFGDSLGGGPRSGHQIFDLH